MSSTLESWSNSGLGLGLQQTSSRFASPWTDVASQFAPRTFRDALTLCEYLYANNSVYKKASERIISYFLTKVKLTGQADDELEKFRAIVEKKFGIMERLKEMGEDYMCFQGDTKVVTDLGIFAIKELDGKTVNVLSKGGVYRPAAFKSYGKQELLEVELSDGRTVQATPEHQWVVLNNSGKEVRIPTTSLRARHRIERTVAPRPEKNEDYFEGVCHGFVFGDGTQCSKNTTSAFFCGPKDKAMLSYFEGHGTCPREVRPGVVQLNGLHGNYKQLPDNTCSASYWYGFVCGFLAADGSVDTHGCAILTQKDRAVLEAIEQQLPRIGMIAGPIRSQTRSTSFRRNDGQVDHYTGEIGFMTLLKRFMQPDDFLIPAHRAKFEAKNKETTYGKYIAVKKVRPTGRNETVYCCVEMETHTFVVENGVLTGQCYGNAFASIIPSFTRMLKCTNCRAQGNDTVVKMLGKPFEFRAGDLSFYTRCHKCHQTCRHMVHDYPDPNPENIKLVRRDPKAITIEHNPERGISNYWMDIDPLIASRIRSGDPFLLATTPWTVIQAVVRNQKYKFNPEYFYHLKEGCISGLKLYGWGLPSVLSAFKDFFRIQVLRRYDEALMMDYIIPMRIISPAGGGTNGSDMLATASMKSFRDNAESAIAKHRIDGADWNIFPFPVEYQAVGGEGRELAPKDLIMDEEDRLLNARGIPPQLYRGDLLLQTAPTALRVFERGWQPLVDGLGQAAQWMVTSIARQVKSGDIEAELASVTLVDDLQQESVRLTLMQAGILSKETGLESMNIDPKNERKRILEETKEDQREQMKAQRELEMEQMNLNTPEGDAQGTGGGEGGGATPMDVQGQGAAIAQQLLDPSVPETARRQQLSQYRSSNPTLHAVIIKEMERLRNSAGTAGQAQAMPQAIQQAQQAQAAAAPVSTPGAAQSQPKVASLDFSKTAFAIMTPDFKNHDALVDSMLDFNKVAGHFPTAINLTRVDEFNLIKWDGARFNFDLDKQADALRTGSLKGLIDELLGLTLKFDAKETSFE